MGIKYYNNVAGAVVNHALRLGGVTERVKGASASKFVVRELKRRLVINKLNYSSG
jgi:hypothetical protein